MFSSQKILLVAMADPLVLGTAAVDPAEARRGGSKVKAAAKAAATSVPVSVLNRSQASDQAEAATAEPSEPAQVTPQQAGEDKAKPLTRAERARLRAEQQLKEAGEFVDTERPLGEAVEKSAPSKSVCIAGCR